MQLTPEKSSIASHRHPKARRTAMASGEAGIAPVQQQRCSSNRLLRPPTRMISVAQKRGTTMVYLFMSDGTRREIADAATANVEDDCLVCRNADGEIVETFDKLA